MHRLDWPMSVDPQAVRALLDHSKQAHSDYLALLPRMTSSGSEVIATNGDLAGAHGALVTARDLRLQAEAADPAFVSPVWRQHENTHPHEALKVFYAKELARLA